MKRNRSATEAMQFVEKKSYVTNDGRWVLYGLDWKRQVKSLRERCGGRCEYEINIASPFFDPEAPERARCSRKAAHPHHRIKRSKGRDDRMVNLIALCVVHHREQHPEKQPMWTRRGAVRDEGVSA